VLLAVTQFSSFANLINKGEKIMENIELMIEELEEVVAPGVALAD
jgi:hypothetical protein